MLTEECIRRAIADGAPQIGLHSGEHRRAARKLYERMGFEPYRELPPTFGFPYHVYSLDLVAEG